MRNPTYIHTPIHYMRVAFFVFSRVLTLIETNETQKCSAVSSKLFFWMRNFVVYIFDSSMYNLTTLTNIWSIMQFKIISSTHQIKELTSSLQILTVFILKHCGSKEDFISNF